MRITGTIAAGSALLATASTTGEELKLPEKPNVLMICIDDLNDYIGCMNGHPNAITPNIDGLAARGTLFNNAHCQAPICGPSRASLMTGLRPSTTGIYGQIHDNQIRKNNPVTKDVVFLPEYLKNNGYKTMGIGKIFHGHAPKGVLEVSGGRRGGFGPKPKKRMNWPVKEVEEKAFSKGFRTSTDWGAYPDKDEKMHDYKYASWTVEKLQEKHDKPFFLAVGFERPHVPWHVPKKWYDMHPPEKIQLPPYKSGDQDDVPEISRLIHEMPQMPTAEWAKKSGNWQEVLQSYLACTTFVDSCVGRVLSALEKSPHKDNTIVILWTDHGYHLGEKNRFCKHSLWEEATHSPLIIAWPGGKKQVCSKPAELLDIYPTLLEMCSLPANKKIDGESLVPLLKNPQSEWNNPAITSYAKNNHAIRTERYRYIVYENGAEELYDHQTDPNEWNNLAGKKEYNSIKAELKTHLPKVNAEWAKHSSYTANPFLKNKIKTRKK